MPRGPLSILKDSWEGRQELPFSIGKGSAEYLQNLKENLEIAKTYAEFNSQKEQDRYVKYHNTRSTDRHYAVGDKVLVLAPEGPKMYSRWHGPGVVTKVKSPYSYVVEIDGKHKHLHVNHLKGYSDRLLSAYNVNNCAVIYDKDNDFGVVETVGDSIDKILPPSQRIEPERLAHLPPEQRVEFLQVLDRYPEVFSEKPGHISVIEHDIKVSSEFKPKVHRSYKIPEVLKPEVGKQIQEMLDLGIIRPSTSEMVSPLVCVLKGHKGQNKVRLAVDFRYLNKFSAGDAYPTPDLQEAMERVSKAHFISCFDAKCGYWQVSLKDSQQWLTGFVCGDEVYEFTRMPFGLKSAGNTFVRAMNIVLKPVRDFTEPFIDDMAVCSMHWPDHLSHLDKYLYTVRTAGITLNLEKCSFA